MANNKKSIYMLESDHFLFQKNRFFLEQLGPTIVNQHYLDIHPWIGLQQHISVDDLQII